MSQNGRREGEGTDRKLGAKAASALTAALSTPYATRHSPYPTSVRRTEQGYSLSSTYVAPPPSAHSSRAGPSVPQKQSFQRPSPSASSWFSPGNTKCSYTGCTFQAAPKSVEIHMMDRHLIFPPDWDKRKQPPSWDADPSLKGKPIPVTGTNILLDSDGAIDAWINERRNRWPSAKRVETKQLRKQEALERGEIVMDELKGRFRPRDTTKRLATTRVEPPVSSEPPIPNPTPAVEVDGNALDASSDGAPEEISSVPPPQERPTRPIPRQASQPARLAPLTAINSANQRRLLLRNLLLPEIRHTISLISQSIHFIVENSYFEGVELKPGDVEHQAIQVIPMEVDS